MFLLTDMRIEKKLQATLNLEQPVGSVLLPPGLWIYLHSLCKFST